MTTRAEWTWLVYMAGDNNLEGAGREDLGEMQSIGSTDQVHILVQFDTEQDKTTRYRVEKDRLATLEQMPGINCGDPKELSKFLQWGRETFPARHYLVDVWNHGGGWENLPADFDYDALRPLRPSRGLRRFRRSLFRSTIDRIHRRSVTARAIAIDCGAQDYLDNQELRQALAQAMPADGRWDVLGCDACLMNMVEIGYEMKDTASLLVGSEETEPAAGWPYAEILRALAAKPGMSPESLAKTIVTEYGRWYRQHGNPAQDGAATQSALDLRLLPAVVDGVNALADALLARLKPAAGPVCLARDKAQKFAMAEYIDLGDFAAQLIQRLPQEAAIKKTATQILRALPKPPGGGFVLANATWGRSVQKATGVSIYFPHDQDYAADYAGLLFSKEARWRKFLEALFKL